MNIFLAKKSSHPLRAVNSFTTSVIYEKAEADENKPANMNVTFIIAITYLFFIFLINHESHQVIILLLKELEEQQEFQLLSF